MTPFAAHTAIGGSDNRAANDDGLKFLALELETQMTFLDNPTVAEQLQELNKKGFRVATKGNKSGIALETEDRKLAMTYRRGEFSDRDTNVAMFEKLLNALSSYTEELKNKTDIVETLEKLIEKSPTGLKSESNFAFLAHVSKEDPFKFASYYDAANQASMANNGKGTELIIYIKKTS